MPSPPKLMLACLAVIGTAVASAHAGPCEPELIGNYTSPGGGLAVCLSGHLAFLADGYRGLTILDTTFQTSPLPVGWLDTDGNSQDVDVVGNTAFVADGFRGLQIIDVSDPTDPIVLGSYDPEPEIIGLRMVGDLAYLAASTAGLLVVDVSDPFAPQLIGQYSTAPAYTINLDVVGNTVYLASNTKLFVLDVTSPDMPALLTSTSTDVTNAWAVKVVGDLLFIADGSAGLKLFNGVSGTQLTLVGSLSLFGHAYDVAVDEGRAYVADGWYGLIVVDVSEPATPAIIGLSQEDTDPRSLASDGNIFYVATTHGLDIVDVTTCQPASPTIIAQPTSRVADAGGPLQFFAVSAANAQTYCWRFDGTPIEDGALYFGTRASTLVVAPRPSTEGIYDVVVTNETGSVASEPAVLGVRQPCAGDVNGDGVLNLDDVDNFVQSFIAGCP